MEGHGIPFFEYIYLLPLPSGESSSKVSFISYIHIFIYNLFEVLGNHVAHTWSYLTILDARFHRKSNLKLALRTVVACVVAPFFETDTDCLFGVSSRRPHAGFDYVSTRPQSLSLFILVVLVIIAESNPILHAPQ
jgi:hypothetical protein